MGVTDFVNASAAAAVATTSLLIKPRHNRTMIETPVATTRNSLIDCEFIFVPFC